MEPVPSYVICCVQRTGSWLLAHTLADTGYAGRPSDYFDEAERQSRTQKWGLPDGGLTLRADAGLEFMRATFPNAQFVWLRREDKVRQGISWWRAATTDQWALRPDQEPAQPALDVDRVVRLVQYAEQCEAGWRQWFASTGIQPCQVVYEDLARDRLAAANRALSFLCLPQLDAADLPPVRYRQQADSLTERYADVVRSAMSSAG
jgi:LPS sulfotransferase NodH